MTHFPQCRSPQLQEGRCPEQHPAAVPYPDGVVSPLALEEVLSWTCLNEHVFAHKWETRSFFGNERSVAFGILVENRGKKQKMRKEKRFSKSIRK